MQEINFRTLLDVLLQHIKVIAIVAGALAIVLALFTGLFVADTYASSCSMYVMNISTDAAGNTSGISTTGLAASQQMVNEYITILQSDMVINDVAAALRTRNYAMENEDIVRTLSMRAVNDTAMLQITATTSDPNLSKAICDALMSSAPEKVTTVMLGLGSVSPVDSAKVGEKVGPSIVRNGLLGAIVGFVLAYGVFLVLHLLDNTVKDEQELKKRLNVNVLGVVPDANPGGVKRRRGGK